jgi:hypothetical protein
MKFFAPPMESPKFTQNIPHSKSEQLPTPTLTEEQAETMLEKLLAHPDNAFLMGVPQNREVIENANSSNEALIFAQKRIRERLVATLEVRKVSKGQLEHIDINPDKIIPRIEFIQNNAVEVGRGNDGRVILNAKDILETYPEICYKFIMPETLRRGRNTTVEELEMQAAFYHAAKKIEVTDIAIPKPYYEIAFSSTQILAMEKLHAKNIDELIKGQGSIPKWFDPDRFCDSLTAFIDEMHAQNLYHRDLQPVNIMISQQETWSEGEPMGYMIDFGLSGYAYEHMDPYKKETPGYVFTYPNDYGTVSNLRKLLKGIKNGQSSEEI